MRILHGEVGTMTTKSIKKNEKDLSIISNLSGDEEWYELVNKIVSELPDDTPDKVIKATELLLVGTPLYEVAKEVGVSTDTVRKWLNSYPTMSAVIANGKKYLSKWRMSKLEQQFIDAVNVSSKILKTSLSSREVNPKVLSAVAQQARYVIGLFVGQKQDISVTHELGESVLNATQHSLNYIAQQLANQSRNADSEPVEAVFKVIDPKFDDASPVLDEHGNPFYGEVGVLDIDEKDRILCHICGERFRSLSKHIYRKHSVSNKDYELLFMLPDGSVRDTEGYWDDNDENES